jgi:HemY protein
MPEVAIHAAQRMAQLHGDLALARAWLLPAWERMVATPDGLGDALRVKLVCALEAGLDSVDADWLSRIEVAQRNNPRDPNLQYIAGMACMKRQLWGKAQQLLTQAGLVLQDADLHRRAWQVLAHLAEARDDADQASVAWKRAAQAGNP